MVYIVLIVGFVFLVKGADLFVSGSSDIARVFHIPPFIIGLTIVACGTSLPEAAISVTAAIQGANGITIGNALGSNLFNLMVALGAAALIKPCPVARSTLRFEYPVSIGAAGLIILLSFGGTESPALSRLDGIVLLAVLVIFLIFLVRQAMRQKVGSMQNVQLHEQGNSIVDITEDHYNEEETGARNISLPKGIVYSIVGAAGIILGGDMVVDAATKIAEAFGIDETLIGLTVVAFGTSLPELVTSAMAAFKGETDIAVGNVIGSNIFNLLLVLGLSASIHPIVVPMFSVYDLIILIIASLIVLIPLARNGEVTRSWGVIMLALYGVYMAYIIGRSM